MSVLRTFVRPPTVAEAVSPARWLTGCASRYSRTNQQGKAQLPQIAWISRDRCDFKHSPRVPLPVCSKVTAIGGVSKSDGGTIMLHEMPIKVAFDPVSLGVLIVAISSLLTRILSERWRAIVKAIFKRPVHESTKIVHIADTDRFEFIDSEHPPGAER